MKNASKILTLTAVVVLSAIEVNAQQNLPAPPPPRPMEGPGPGKDRPAPPQQALKALTSISGKVVEYNANDRYEYDGLTLRSSEKNIAVKFPPHLAAQLMKAAAKGAEVSINGVYDETPDGPAFRLYSVKAGSTTITDTPPAVEQTPPVEKTANFSGSISDLNHDQRGMINGIVLNSKTFIALPPPAIEQLGTSLKVGTQLSGTGVQRPTHPGVVLAKNIEVTDARTLSIAGQTYLVR